MERLPREMLDKKFEFVSAMHMKFTYRLNNYCCVFKPYVEYLELRKQECLYTLLRTAKPESFQLFERGKLIHEQ